VSRTPIALAVAVGLAGLVYLTADVLLLVFGGILLALFLLGLSELVSRWTSLSQGWSLAIVLLALSALVALGSWYIGAQAAAQFDQLARELPRSVVRLTNELKQYAWGEQLLNSGTIQNMVSGKGDLFSKITGIFSTALGAITALVVILFVGIYMAVDPGLYESGRGGCGNSWKDLLQDAETENTSRLVKRRVTARGRDGGAERGRLRAVPGQVIFL
jgi:predicted PurR-regulated permease PerM